MYTWEWEDGHWVRWMTEDDGHQGIYLHDWRGRPPCPDDIKKVRSKWWSTVQRIDDSSWLILDKAILRRLPISEHQPMPHDYVDEAEGFIYRIQELLDGEAPKVSGMPEEGDEFVRPFECGAWDPYHIQFKVGTSALLRLQRVISPLTAREHENIEYVASKKPKTFKVPEVFYHVEAGGVYGIFVESLGTPMWSKMRSKEVHYRVQKKVADVIAEMAEWESTSIEGVSGKVLSHEMFYMHRPSWYLDALWSNEALEAWFADHEFDVSSSTGFTNTKLGQQHIGLDENLNFIGFNNWAHCGFVPKGIIMANAVSKVSQFLFQPVRQGMLRNEFMSRVGASLAVDLHAQGFPNELEKWDSMQRDAFGLETGLWAEKYVILSNQPCKGCRAWAKSENRRKKVEARNIAMGLTDNECDADI